MIAGDTKQLDAYRSQLPKKVYECLEKIKAFDFSKPDGKYDIENCGVMSVESPMTEPAVDRKLEGHEKFIDVVYLIEGEEWIRVVDRHEAEAVTESYPDRDLYFFDSHAVESQVYMLPGRFLICYPEDLHRPLCAGTKGCESIRKAVLKLSVDLS